MMDEIKVLAIYDSYESANSAFLILKSIIGEDVDFYFEIKEVYLSEHFAIVCNHKVVEMIKTIPMPKIEDFS
jgi:hypothetical protein